MLQAAAVLCRRTVSVAEVRAQDKARGAGRRSLFASVCTQQAPIQPGHRRHAQSLRGRYLSPTPPREVKACIRKANSARRNWEASLDLRRHGAISLVIYLETRFLPTGQVQRWCMQCFRSMASSFKTGPRYQQSLLAVPRMSPSTSGFLPSTQDNWNRRARLDMRPTDRHFTRWTRRHQTACASRSERFASRSGIAQAGRFGSIWTSRESKHFRVSRCCTNTAQVGLCPHVASLLCPPPAAYPSARYLTPARRPTSRTPSTLLSAHHHPRHAFTKPSTRPCGGRRHPPSLCSADRMEHNHSRPDCGCSGAHTGS